MSEYYNGQAGSNGMAGTKPYANGFAALKSLDSNADNQFNNQDAAWTELRVWQDANHDGKTDAGELKTFTELGISSINPNSIGQSGEVRDGNEVLARGTFTQTVNGTSQTREAIAANFLANPAGSSISAYVSGNTDAAINETLSATALGVMPNLGQSPVPMMCVCNESNWRVTA